MDPNLLPNQMRGKEKTGRNQKADDSPEAVLMHMPEEPVELETAAVEIPPAPPDKKAVAPRAVKKIKSRPAAERQVISQTQDLVKEKARGISLADIFNFGKKKAAPAKQSAKMNFVAPAADSVVHEVFWRNLARLSSGLLSLTVILCLVFTGIKIYQLRLLGQSRDFEQQIKTIDNQIAAYKTDQANVIKLQRRADSLRQVLANQLIWTALFAQLEKLTLPGVQYSAMAADYASGVALTAQARDYQTLAEQLYVFQQAVDSFSSAEILSAQLQPSPAGEYVSFNITLQLKPELLKSYAGQFVKK